MMNPAGYSRFGLVAARRAEKLYLAIIDRDGTACHLCGEETEPMERSADHVVPSSLGGSDRLLNRKLAHKKCDGLRGTTPIAIARPIIRWYRDGWITRVEASDLLWRAKNARADFVTEHELTPRRPAESPLARYENCVA